jgi:hypothetical protein
MPPSSRPQASATSTTSSMVPRLRLGGVRGEGGPGPAAGAGVGGGGQVARRQSGQARTAWAAAWAETGAPLSSRTLCWAAGRAGPWVDGQLVPAKQVVSSLGKEIRGGAVEAAEPVGHHHKEDCPKQREETWALRLELCSFTGLICQIKVLGAQPAAKGHGTYPARALLPASPRAPRPARRLAAARGMRVPPPVFSISMGTSAMARAT